MLTDVMKIVLMVPGYGSQYIGMGKDLYDNSRLVQEYFELASTCLDINFVKLCFAESDTELSQIAAAYPALFLLQSAGAGLLREAGIPIHAVAGYDIGAFGALFAAGGINLPDGLYLLSKWVNLYTTFLNANEMAGLSIQGLSERKIRLALEKINEGNDIITDIGIFKTRTHSLLFGPLSAIQKLEKLIASEEGVITEQWPLQTGMYTSALDRLVRTFAMYLEKVDCKDLSAEFFTGSKNNGHPFSGEKVKKFLQRYFSRPLHWSKVMEQCASATAFIIPMKAPSLRTEIETWYPDKPVFMLNSLADLTQIKNYVQQVSSTQEEA
jgi:[acyl-carrier-protein] S-malonyltransferase